MEIEPQDDVKRTLLPRFSTRTLFVLFTVSSLVFVAFGMAAQGREWAWGMTIAIITLVVTAVVHAAWFGIVWIVSSVLSPQNKDVS
jgi:hypothetical protein